MAADTINLLIYDIPTGSRMPNPSAQLRQVAVRINLSCWVIRERDIPWSLLDRIQNAGGRAHVAPFAEQAGEALTKIIVESLTKELDDCLSRAQEASAAAVGGLDTQTQEEIDNSGRYHLGVFRQKAYTTVRKLQQALHDVRAVADRFGVADSEFPLSNMRLQVETIQVAMNERARRYAEAGRLAYATGTATGEAISRAVEADAIPADIVADYLDDEGQDGAAAGLRVAFR